MRELPVVKLNLNTPEAFGNVAEKLDDAERKTLANDLLELVKIDENSMSEWLGKALGYLNEMDAEHGDGKPEDREQEGSGEKPPPSTELTLSAVIQFAARATDALLGEPDLAKASETGGEALASWVSSQLRTKDPNWILDTDPLVIHMAVTGLAWRKRSFDDIDRTFNSTFLTCSEVIVNKSIRNIERAPRVTHDFERYPYEIERSMERGHWIDYKPNFYDADPEAPKKFYETDLWLDLDGDSIAEPWTVVISRDDVPEVIKIAPRWSASTIVNTKDVLFFKPVHRFYPYRFLPDPKGGFFPMGFGKLLNRVESSADDLLASITDTAQSESQNGGVMGGSQFGLPDKIELKGNRVTTIPTDGQPLEKVFSPFPTKSVSAGSVQVLEKIMALADRLAGTVNMLSSIPASTTATVAKGIIDSGTQVQSAVHRRLVTELTQELRQFVQMASAYKMLPEGVQATDGNGVAVTADPQLATEMQRSAMGSLYLELCKEPMIFNAQECALRFGQVMRLPEPEKLVAPPQTPQATPDEKMKGMLGLMKHQNDKIKITGQVAQQLSQAMLNLVTAAGGMQDNQQALLVMAQLEHAVKAMVEEAGNASTSLNGMAQQPGDGGAPGGAAPQIGGDAGSLSGGGSGGPGNAGAGGGVQ
jgi:hypothetical protein